jgi:hypothetical protein
MLSQRPRVEYNRYRPVAAADGRLGAMARTLVTAERAVAGLFGMAMQVYPGDKSM